MKKLIHVLFYLLAILVVILIYYLLSKSIDNNMILPKMGIIGDYFKTLKWEVLITNIYSTIFRTVLSYGFSLLVALLLVLIVYFVKIENFIQPYISIMRSLPTISIILILLIWLGNQKAIFVIPVILLIPIMYETFIHQLKNVDSKLKEVCKVYHFSHIKKMRYLYFYPLFEGMMLAFKQTFGLCFKIIVMAEVIAQSDVGIGAKIQSEKVNLEMAGVFAWTIILIILVICIDKILDLSKKKLIKWK